MRIRAFGLGIPLVIALLAAPFVEAQQTGKVWRVGVLTSSNIERIHRSGGFVDGLRELGWTEGQNVAFEVRSAEDMPAKLPGLAAELVRSRVDVIFAHGPFASHAAKDATPTIPIVFLAANPVGRGLVVSLARPGGNLTGMTNSTENMRGKDGQLLKELIPNAKQIAWLVNPSNPIYQTFDLDRWRAEVTRALGVTIQRVEARSRQELALAMEAAARARADGLVVSQDPVFFAERQAIVDLALKHRLPAIYGWREAVDAGGLISYGTNQVDLERRAATFVDRILKGAKPADLPVEQPTKFELVINLKTAKALGLTIPPSLLLRADQIIE